jgi:DNA invertase Pin-like site-specific DNA recombinase
MSNSGLVQAQHLGRQAVIYIRQSTPHQVLTNTESRRMQHAMKEHAVHLGWHEPQIRVVETDTGVSATSTAGREAYKNLLSHVAEGQVGVVLSYESARLSRNCSDWYPLLDACALSGCLIADRDGIYDPATANGRMLLGMKGILSEMELHTLRGRLIAGLRNKAQRGELALALPAGLVRLDDDRVVKEPDLEIQHRIDLIFSTFLELKSATKTVRYFMAHELTVPKRHRNDTTVWRPATAAGIIAVLRNPAYAGAFVYGKTRTVQSLGSARPQQRRRKREEWPVIVQDRYPAYISWETFERIQSMLADNYAEYDRNKSRGVPRPGAALLQGLIYCGECGHKMQIQYKGGTRYLCNHHRFTMQLPVCQFLPADPIDQHVVRAFFDALSPAELDLYEKAMRSRQSQWAEVQTAQQRQLQRLRYEVELARRQYDRVDPDNRLVASELERRWESALRELHETEERIEQQRRERDKVVPLRVSRDLRTAFSSLGQSLPQLWSQDVLAREQRKALLRCLIDKVVVRRKEQREVVYTRVVWRGGAVSEIDVPVTVKSVGDLSRCDEMEELILELEAQGKSDDEIAASLTAQGLRSPMRERLLPSTVRTIRLRHQRVHRYSGPRPRRVEGSLTLPQLAKRLGVKPHWLYHLINRGVIKAKVDRATRLYLFPDSPKLIADLRRLRARNPPQVSPRKEHQDA